MFTLSYFLIAIALIASFQGASARPAGLRRRCRATASASSSSSSSSGGGGAVNVGSTPTAQPQPSHSAAPKPQGCFPSANFDTPSGTPQTALSDWWCPRTSEYAFLGVSYGVDSCPSKQKMIQDFTAMKNQYNARYVRIYAACDNSGFNDDLVSAAYESGLGVFALVWFGFDGSDQWKTRMANLLSTVQNNPLAPYVIRNIAIGEEALFDNDLSGAELASNIKTLQSKVSKFGIQVTTSDMAYKWADNTDVVDAVPHIESNTLPFFSGSAGWGGDAWGVVQSDLNTYSRIAGGKKVILTQTGWPSNQNVWPANSASAVSSVGSEAAYYQMLDSHCGDFKAGPQGGVGWFAHIWSDDDLSGWGLTSGNDNTPKFAFKARTHC